MPADTSIQRRKFAYQAAIVLSAIAGVMHAISGFLVTTAIGVVQIVAAVGLFEAMKSPASTWGRKVAVGTCTTALVWHVLAAVFVLVQMPSGVTERAAWFLFQSTTWFLCNIVILVALAWGSPTGVEKPQPRAREVV